MEGSVVTPESTLSDRELVARITDLAGQLNAAHYQWLALIAEFDRRRGWNDGGSRSCAHWLNWKVGLDLGAAREKVRVAQALATLPRISAAMARGELSYSKVRALTRVAEPATEDYLLSIALHGTAHHVEKLVRCYRRVCEAQELGREARQQARRELVFHHDDDGSLVIRARLPAEAGAVLLKALEVAVGELPQADVSAETSPVHESTQARRADALGAIAESFLQNAPAALSGGDRQQIVVHVDAATLRHRRPGRCELDDGPGVSAETVRRLGCDASLVMMIDDEAGEPLDVGRKTRSIPPALRRALRSRDRGCRFPGCTHTRFVDGHHIHHWADGGATKLSNLVSLCRFHHRQVHEGGVKVEVLDDGALRFLRADGRPFDQAVCRAPVGEPRVLPDERWVALGRAAVAPDAAISRWRGESMDYGTAIDALLRRRGASHDVSAETSSFAVPHDGEWAGANLRPPLAALHHRAACCPDARLRE